MQGPKLIPSARATLLLALGLGASTLVGAGGCADRGGFEICADSEIEYGYGTCFEPWDPMDNEELRVNTVEVCFEGSEGCDPCDAERIVGAAIERTEADCSVVEIERTILGCGPDPEAEDCCYLVRVEGDFSCGVEGRPLLARAAGGPRVASLRPGRAWLADRAALAQLQRPRDPQLRAALHRRWTASARYEHASVASFARVGAQLLALGAPAALLRAAQRAMGDELRHAQLCFAVAAAYGDAAPAGAGALRVEGCTGTGMDLDSVVREAIFEGALGEGAASLEALEGAQSCTDPVIREVLQRIGEDEQRHALLGYQTVQWALRAHPERARAIVSACLREGQLQAAAARAEAASAREPAAVDIPRHYGLVGPRRRVELRHATWTELVAPILSSLLNAAREGAAALPAANEAQD